MENILLIIDGARMDSAMIDFSCYLARLTKSRLRAIFIEQHEEAAYPGMPNMFAKPENSIVYDRNITEKQKTTQECASNEKLFAETCISNGLEFTISGQYRSSNDLLVKESRFADMMVIHPQTSFSNQLADIPSSFAKEVLENAECPVIIAPASFDGIDRLLFAFDGSRSCVFAIKQFAHLFPQLKNFPVTLLQVGNAEDAFIDDAQKIKELLDIHFPNNYVEKLKGDPDNELFGYLLGKRNMFVVMGAYGRSNVSRFFRQSTADIVLKTINLPVFITHF